MLKLDTPIDFGTRLFQAEGVEVLGKVFDFTNRSPQGLSNVIQIK